MNCATFFKNNSLNIKGGKKRVAKDVEKNLIKELKKGKEEAYVSLLKNYGNRLIKTCYLMLKDEKDAEDIVQETFIKVFSHINSFKGASSLYTWIYRIAINLCKDRLKTKREYLPYEEWIETEDSVEEIVLLSIDIDNLRKALWSLSPIYNEVLILFYFEELSIKEIGEILDEKEGTVKSKLSRGRMALKKALEEGGIYDE
nr:RNA polymerase sigma factor [Tissierella simiarum]